MGIQQKLHTKLVQKLILTPSLQQAIKLLPMSTLELSDLLNQEMVENPMLEEVPTEELQPAEAAPSIGRSAPEAALDREAAFDCQIAARGIAEPAHAEYLIAPEHDAAPAAEAPRPIAHQLDFGITT